MLIDNVFVVSPPDYIHSQCFYDIAMSFSKSLQELHHPAVLTIDPNAAGTTLVFGAHLLSKFNAQVTGDYIIYQTEQLTANDSLFVDFAYIELLKHFPVWDYSQHNVDFLKTHSVYAKHVPIGYHPCLSNIVRGESVTQIGGGKNGKQRVDYAAWSGEMPSSTDIDVCFFGSMNPRRQRIIDKLKSIYIPGKLTDGMDVERKLTVAAFTGYGAFRDRVIARSKIVLNMHYYDSAIFEIFRVAPLLANRKLVVSETGSDKALEAQYEQALSFCSYDELVDRITGLLSNYVARESLADAGYEIFSQIRQVEILKHVLLA